MMRALMPLASIAALCTLTLACGSAPPPPVQHVANVQSAVRTASELGAQNQPKAQLHLKLAKEQLAKARVAMDKEDNPTASHLLIRAKADAELAIALMREHDAQQGALAATTQAAEQRATNAERGITP